MGTYIRRKHCPPIHAIKLITSTTVPNTCNKDTVTFTKFKPIIINKFQKSYFYDRNFFIVTGRHLA